MTEINLASMQGVALGFSIGVTLLYIARRRLGDWTRTAQERTKLDEHAQLTTDLAVTKSRLNDLSSEISALTERLDLSVVHANELQGQLTDSKGEHRAVAATLASELNGSNDLRRRLEEAERLLNQHRSTADEVYGKLESPRILRRLQTLRRWSHEQEIKSFFTRGACTRCSDGARA